MNHLDPKKISACVGTRFINLAYLGGTLREVIDTFWYAERAHTVESVYIGINFSQYNQTLSRDTVGEAEAIQANPLRYFNNLRVVRAGVYNLRFLLTNIDPQVGVPRLGREEFWKFQLGPVTEASYGHYVYPEQYKLELRAIGDYCRRRSISLRFVIFPTHVDLQQRVADFGLTREWDRFKQDLIALGTTYDFDYPNPITLDRNNFVDPYHTTGSVGDDLIGEIWGGKPRVAKLLRFSNSDTTSVRSSN